jgi:hypothetical protein
VSWIGRLYGNGLPRLLLGGSGRIYHGVWGSAAFQSVYEPATGVLASLPLMPEWYLGVISLLTLGTLGLLWPPMVIALAIAGLCVLISVGQAAASARKVSFGLPKRERHVVWALRLITAILHLVQPLARLRGRLEHGLTPWRRRGVARWTLRMRGQYTFWTERWEAAESRLERIERDARRWGALVRRGGCFDRWDLQARGGLLGGVRLRMTIEEHGAGQQLVRFKVWPTIRSTVVIAAACLAVLTAGAARDGATATAIILASLGLMLMARSAYECSVAGSTVHEALSSGEADQTGIVLADETSTQCERAANAASGEIRR